MMLLILLTFFIPNFLMMLSKQKMLKRQQKVFQLSQLRYLVAPLQ